MQNQAKIDYDNDNEDCYDDYGDNFDNYGDENYRTPDLENYVAIMLERKPFILEVMFYIGDLCVNVQIKTNWNLVYTNIYQVCYIQN